MKGRIKKDEGRNEIVAEKFSYFLVPTFYFAAATVWLVISELAAASWYRAHERDLSQMTRWEIRWPREAANFHEIKIDEDIRRALRFDRGQAASWTVSAANSATESANVKPLNCTLFFFRWNPGKNSALLANLHRPDVCLPSTGWNQTSDAGIENFPVTEKFSLPFRRFKFRHGITGQPTEQTAHAFYCLWEDQLSASRLESSLPTMSGSASAWSRSERVRAVLEGRRHLGQQVLELVIQGRGSLNEQQVEAEFARIIPNVVRIESEK